MARHTRQPWRKKLRAVVNGGLEGMSMVVDWRSLMGLEWWLRAVVDTPATEVAGGRRWSRDTCWSGGMIATTRKLG
ncbi:MFS transporter [Sesbania bispinosa]|nr:MFS transporter [Sesbania bispinosa]